MNAERWQQIEEIFQSALDLAPAEREAFISKQCGEDADLKREVEKLLSDFDSADSFIESPVWTNNQFLDSSARSEFKNSLDKQLKDYSPDQMIGKQIGVYQLTAEIGRGGMGAVYQAERADGSFRQRVAIKLIKRGMDTDFILRRFRQERQILAALNHPFIARLLDGGTTADDLPYFVMEFIEGEPLYKFCDRKKLNITERLKLFRQICEALDFAHQNKIIHRDIKPPNILVTRDGTPKLLDFGIAKVLNPDLSVDITLDPTATAMRLMTPEYASPEQVCGSPVTPASDIYSLGVLLYELLTGHRPYQFRNRAPHEIARVICEEEPDRPSTGITREDNLLPTGASEATTLVDIYLFRGAANIEDLQQQIAGDLEKIILKCLRKEPDERYQTAAKLADDITRYLKGVPVVAETQFAAVELNNSVEKIDVKSLAVLPLKILNVAANADTGEEEYLGIGLADALVTRLSNVRRLTVRPTSSVLPFSDSQTNPFAAGRELGVNFVLDGSVRRVGERIRVTVQLLNVGENSSRWAESFNENFTDVLELEDSISERVVKSLIPQLTGEEQQKLQKRGTNKSEAYEAYLRGRYHWNQFTPDALIKARDAFQKAIEIDPNYALAYVGLADFYIWANIYGLIPSSEAVMLAQTSALRAIEIDAQLGEAYASLGLTYQNRFSWKRAEELYERALELAPNYVHAHEWWAAQLVGHGDFEKGVAEIKISERLDPLSLRTKTLTAWTLYQARQFDEALSRAQQIIDMDANYPQGNLQSGLALLAMGKASEALPYFQKFDAMIPGSALAKYHLCFACAAANRRDDAKRVLEEIKQLAADGYVKPFFLGMAHAALDKKDEAFAYFEQSIAENDPWMLWFGTEPMLDSLRGDNHFDDLLRRMNNPLAKAKKNKTAPPQITHSEKSIAVLPLKLVGTTGALNNTGGDEYLPIGLADALVTRLSNVRRFIVRPTSSVLKYGKKPIDAFTAGKELGVDFIVDGTIRRVGNRIRVTAQLLSIVDNATRWAQSFDEDSTDVLTLEDSISEQVAKSLIPHLTGEEKQQIRKRGTDNAEAFEAYLRGRHYWNSFTEEGFVKALIFYNQAIAAAPDYALAYAGIADYFNLIGLYAILPFSETSAAAKEAAEKAIALDRKLAEGYAALGFAVLMNDFDWQAAEKNLARAVELNPNYSTGRLWYSYFLGLKGESDEALKQAEAALKLDPLSPIVPHAYNLNLYYAGRFDEAIASTEKLIEKEPNYGMAQLFLSSVLWLVGRTKDAIKLADRAVLLLGRTTYTLMWLAAAYAADGQTTEARKTIREIEELSARRFASPYMLAIAYYQLGETERTLELLEKAFEIRDGRLVWLGVDPQFEGLRNEPRFRSILRQTNNPYIKN